MNNTPRHMLRGIRAPDEAGAERRAWDVVHSAYLNREPVRRTRSRRRFALVPVLAVIAAALLLSVAGARVGRFISHALVGMRHPAAALSSLPAPGRILVSGPGGTWITAADGSTRHVGSWPQASWSPRGLYVAVASADRLAAVDPRGDVHWAIARPQVSDPRWYSPSGYRVAYLSADTLRVIAGDGTADHLLATHVARVAPAWRPGQKLGPFEVAYVTDGNRIAVRDGDSGALLWTASPGSRPRKLLWSDDGQRLVVVSPHGARVYAATGAPSGTITLPAGDTTSDAALSPDGQTLAFVLNGDQVVVTGTASSKHPALRQLLAGSGVREVNWSPDGHWLLVAWPAADQWVFVRVAGGPHVAAVSRIAQQFSATGSARPFPQLEGWCCTVQGSAG
jgi:dipeptidyl aminopeptidase/acylaminoacyl peptidase